MRNKILAGLALAALAAVPAAAAPSPALMLDAEASVLAAAKSAAQSGGVRVWVDNHRDFFRSSDRLRVRVRSEHDGYLAVFHIDTNGDVDILYPRSEHDDGWVERGRTLTLGSRGRYDHLNVRGGHGVGYVMAVALEEPLELWRVRDLYRPRFAGWDADRSIYGDPFYAMDEIVRAVVPETSYGYESVDYYTYHIGRRYEYPRYACYDGYGDWYSDYSYSYYGRSRCDRVRVILINRPWYYDTYRWRGSRRVYYDRYYRTAARNRPLHGYKERTESYAPPARSTAQRRPGSSSAGTPAARGGVSSARPESTRPTREGTVSSRPETRPGREGAVSSRRPENGGSSGGAASRRPESTERAGPSSRPERGTYEPRVRDRGEGRGAGEPRASGRPDGGASQPRQPEQSSAQPPQQDKPVEPARERPTFQRRPSERSAEPRRESPPRNSEPRRESPPSRSAEPRRESPPARSAEPRRESPPERSSEPRRESSPSRGSGGGSRTRPG
ncbi:DUF4384 domain-containing protein [Longimicrobium sp.]|uniref:DUF4384 domain-containing protein n=1 Tax=Longimicrobium sp. TaxID=2029185 RepID=UPI003B3B47BB